MGVKVLIVGIVVPVGVWVKVLLHRMVTVVFH